jgi:hypothetical protein
MNGRDPEASLNQYNKQITDDHVTELERLITDRQLAQNL